MANGVTSDKTWVALTGHPSSVVDALAELLVHSLCPVLPCWLALGGLPLVPAFQEWLASHPAPTPQLREHLDWWLAEWQANQQAVRVNSRPVGAIAIGDWATLSSTAAELLAVGLARLARPEPGVIWSQAPLELLAANANVVVVWVVMAGAETAETLTMTADGLLQATPMPIHVVILEPPSTVVQTDHADPWAVLHPLQAAHGRFKLSGRLPLAAVEDGTLLGAQALADVVLRLNLPAAWLPPCG